MTVNAQQQTTGTIYYYETLVASQQYHKPEPLTYASDKKIMPGTVVVIELKTQRCTGIILRKVPKPRFAAKNILRVVSASPVPAELLQLHQWLAEYYPAPQGLITLLCAPSSLIAAAKKIAIDNDERPAHMADQRSPDLPTPTANQQLALSAINAANRSVLLHGDTGSGKTYVYVRLALECLAHGKSVLLITPEISLTPQLIETFTKYIKHKTVVVHSTLSATERREAWLSIAGSKDPIVVIGARSALFSPLHSIGIIVVDEAHDDALKQEQLPRYQATRVAAQLAKFHHAKLILGSATPTISDYYTFAKKELPIVRMTDLAISGTQELNTHIVDLKDTQKFTKSRWISDVLITSIEHALLTNKQALLFLNRRGSARFVICKECGWQAVCPNCDLPLTYHHDLHSLRCHTCGHKSNILSVCPLCNSTQLLYKSIGTKAVAEEVSRLFPSAKVVRFDSDTPKSERIEKQYVQLRDGTVDILVGTQMVTKGLDLPRLAVVGVIIADTSLYFPDYTAEERTFQMIAQVRGRVGRGHGAGTVIVQTYDPNLPAITYALDQKYEAFYAQQIPERKALGFPPYCYALKLWTTKKTRSAAEKAITNIAHQLQDTYPSVTVIGPSPAFAEKTTGGFTWQLVITAPKRHILTNLIKNLASHINYDLDPATLL